MKCTSLAALSLAALTSSLSAQCVIQPTGTAINPVPIDNWTTTSFPIGFTFPFNGQNYTDVMLSDHGLVALTNGTPATPPPGGSAVWTPQAANVDTFGFDMIFAYWGDHTVQNVGQPTAPAGMWIDNTSGTHCTITWVDNEPFSGYTAGAFSCQVTIFPSGEIRIRLDNRCNNTSSTYGAVETVIGVHQFNNVPLPASSNLSQSPTTVTNASCFEEFVGPGPGTSNTPDPNFDLNNTTLTFTPLSPGWLVLPTPLVCAETSSVGSGCGGLTLTSTRTPFTGGDWSLELSGVTAPAPLPNFLAFGTTTPPSPVGVLFPSLFAAACNAHMDASLGLVDIGPATAGTATLMLNVPTSPAFVGLDLTAQGMSLDVANNVFVLSNGEQANIGY